MFFFVDFCSLHFTFSVPTNLKGLDSYWEKVLKQPFTEVHYFLKQECEKNSNIFDTNLDFQRSEPPGALEQDAPRNTNPSRA